MILVTVGTQLPFDRLIYAVDRWAATHKSTRVFAQIGESNYKPTACEFVKQMAPAEFSRLVRDASLVVSHAGMGTILGALELGKPVIVMPRKASLGEHRNDHQLATVDQLRPLNLIRVADSENDLPALLDQNASPSSARISPYASKPLLAGVSRFIHGSL